MINLIEINERNQIRVREMTTYKDGEGLIRAFHSHVVEQDASKEGPLVKKLREKLPLVTPEHEDGFHKILKNVRISVGDMKMLVTYKRFVVKDGEVIASEEKSEHIDPNGNHRNQDPKVQIIADVIR